AVAAIAVEEVPAGAQAARSAGRRDSLPVAIGIGAGQRDPAQIVVGVGGDEEVEAAVAIIVEKGRAGKPVGVIGLGARQKAGARGDVGEGPVTVVVVQGVFAPVRDKEV